MVKNDYLERVLKARVYDVAIESPLELAASLSKRLGNRLFIKREDLQPVFSFKLRGAYNKMAGSSVMLNSPPPGGDGQERLSGAGAQGARLRRGDRVAARDN